MHVGCGTVLWHPVMPRFCSCRANQVWLCHNCWRLVLMYEMQGDNIWKPRFTRSIIFLGILRVAIKKFSAW